MVAPGIVDRDRGARTDRDVSCSRTGPRGADIGQDRTFGRRRGWTIGQRVRAPDSYGVLFLLIVASIFASTANGSVAGTSVATVLQVATAVYALWTSRATSSTRRIVAVVVAAAAVASILASSGGSSKHIAGVSGAQLALTLVSLIAVVRRLGKHPVVNGETLMGAMSVYLLLGLAFAAIYGVVGSIQSGGFFVGVGDGTWSDRLYFSFVTLTTVGFGDLTTSSGIGRMFAITEALSGQLYLVSVVALVVGNLGRALPRGDPGDES